MCEYLCVLALNMLLFCYFHFSVHVLEFIDVGILCANCEVCCIRLSQVFSAGELYRLVYYGSVSHDLRKEVSHRCAGSVLLLSSSLSIYRISSV